MAQATGYICDVCEKFTLRKQIDWFILTTDNGAGKLDICSNRCLVNLGRTRLKAEREPAGNGPPSEKAKPFTTQGMDITDEMKLAVVQEAVETSVKAAAEAHNLPWQAVAKWKMDLVGKNQ